MKHYLKAIHNYANFKGRASRSDYWYFILFNAIFAIVASYLDKALGFSFVTPKADPSGLQPAMAYGYIYVIYTLAVFIPGLSLTVRRLHDVGKSGWWYVGFMVYMVLVAVVLMATLLGAGINGGIPSSFPVTALVAILTIVAAGIWFFILMCTKGHPGENKWGLNPLEEEAENVQ
jgi:uncharacterized membrane protein YhaH (DUF805 family)